MKEHPPALNINFTPFEFLLSVTQGQDFGQQLGARHCMHSIGPKVLQKGFSLPQEGLGTQRGCWALLPGEWAREQHRG